MLDYIPTTLTMIAFLFGVYQYHLTQKWKKMEFVAALIKEFTAAPEVKNVMKMLDWYEREILLFPEAEGQSRFVFITDEIMSDALVPHDGHMNFSREQVAIRENFDVFLDHLETFEHFIAAGLVSKREFEPYLTYWIDLIASSSKKRPVQGMDRLRGYIHFYDFTGVQGLCARYGKPLNDGNLRIIKREQDPPNSR